MAEPRDHAVRRPAVAGIFYPESAVACREEAMRLLHALPAAEILSDDRHAAARGAIVPHAGWVCSGAIAGQAIAALAQSRPEADLVVVFAAIHTAIEIEQSVFDPHDRWAAPGEDSEISTQLRDALAGDSRFVIDERFHVREHAVEVELPLIQLAWPRARILPIETPPVESAVEMGAAVARSVERAGLNAVYLASSDLTHYGPAYGFTPAGAGEAALDWAMENDRRLLRFVTDMTIGRIVSEARSKFNACGPGAIAAMLAACSYHGATSAKVLTHASSYQTLAKVAPQQPDNAVGYAGVLVG